jgi:hypothetical protein
MVDRGLVVRARLFQHVIEHVGASRGSSRALSGRVDCKGLVPVVVVLLRACLVARLLAFVAPLVLLLGLFGHAALRRRILHYLAFLAIKDVPHRLLTGGKASGDVEQLIGVDRWAAPELAHEVPAGRALKKSMHDLELGHAREFSTAFGKAPYEVP